MDTIEPRGYGPFTHFDAVQVVGPDGTIYARVPEPQARHDTRAGMPLPWDETAWMIAARDAAWDWAVDHMDDLPMDDDTGMCMLVWDPERDDTAEEPLNLHYERRLF